MQAALNDLAERVKNIHPVLADIGEYLVESTKRRFASGTAPDGTPWAPNRPVTIDNYLDLPDCVSRTGRDVLRAS
ncbi:MAG TPA: phage virion morphogenesis protein [Methylococcus sp.]|nr:phage virion morphogenesis protein [Methylococcus sp.]